MNRCIMSILSIVRKKEKLDFKLHKYYLLIDVQKLVYGPKSQFDSDRGLSALFMYDRT